MATTATKRIGSPPSAGNTSRVATNGYVATIFGDRWGGSWGNSWGNTWSSITDEVPASPATDTTSRIAAAPTPGNTKRVSGL